MPCGDCEFFYKFTGEQQEDWKSKNKGIEFGACSFKIVLPAVPLLPASVNVHGRKRFPHDYFNFQKDVVRVIDGEGCPMYKRREEEATWLK